MKTLKWLMPETLAKAREIGAKNLTVDSADHYYRGFNDCFKEMEPLIEALKYIKIDARVKQSDDKLWEANNALLFNISVAEKALKKVGIE